MGSPRRPHRPGPPHLISAKFKSVAQLAGPHAPEAGAGRAQQLRAAHLLRRCLGHARPHGSRPGPAPRPSRTGRRTWLPSHPTLLPARSARPPIAASRCSQHGGRCVSVRRHGSSASSSGTARTTSPAEHRTRSSFIRSWTSPASPRHENAGAINLDEGGRPADGSKGWDAGWSFFPLPWGGFMPKPPDWAATRLLALGVKVGPFRASVASFVKPERQPRAPQRSQT
jgi:hypothetical protein